MTKICKKSQKHNEIWKIQIYFEKRCKLADFSTTIWIKSEKKDDKNLYFNKKKHGETENIWVSFPKR